MRWSANITAVIAGLVWFGLTCLGSDLLLGIFEQNALGYPNVAQIAYYFLFPLSVLIVIAGLAWRANRKTGRYGSLGWVSAGSLFLLLFYLSAYTGGV